MRPQIVRARLKRAIEDCRGLLAPDRHGGAPVLRTRNPAGRRPVLVLYGSPAPRRVYDVFESRLDRDGFAVWSLNLGSRFDGFGRQGIDDCAERLHFAVEGILEEHRVGPLAIVGEFHGGLVARYYVKRLGGDRRVSTLVTLGTPHHGTPAAYLGAAATAFLSRSARQLAPMSPFLRRLQLCAFPRHVRFVSIYSKDDRLSPFPTCILDADGRPNLFNVEIEGVRHSDLLLRRQVYDAVRRELTLRPDHPDLATEGSRPPQGRLLHLVSG